MAMSIVIVPAYIESAHGYQVPQVIMSVSAFQEDLVRLGALAL
ncbi:hypothetical protein [Halobacillus andaensis]